MYHKNAPNREFSWAVTPYSHFYKYLLGYILHCGNSRFMSMAFLNLFSSALKIMTGILKNRIFCISWDILSSICFLLFSACDHTRLSFASCICSIAEDKEQVKGTLMLREFPVMPYYLNSQCHIFIEQASHLWWRKNQANDRMWQVINDLLTEWLKSRKE